MTRLKPQIEAKNLPLPASERLMSEVGDIKTARVSASQKIGYTLLNRQLLGEVAPVVAPGSFMSDLTTPSRAYEGLALASLGRPVMMVDMPGHGLSSRHNPRQTYDLCFKRSLKQQVSPLVEAVLSVLSPEDQIDYFGISYGSLLALEMTRDDPNDRVDCVFGVDLPAVKKRWSLGLQLGYLLIDGRIGRRFYNDQLFGGLVADSFDNFSDDFNRLGVEPASSFIRNNPTLNGLSMLMSPGARPLALDCWQEIMDQKSTSVEVVTAELSSVSDYQAIDIFINSMMSEHQRRSRQTVVYGEDHNIGMAPLIPRAVDWARQAYGPDGS